MSSMTHAPELNDRMTHAAFMRTAEQYLADTQSAIRQLLVGAGLVNARPTEVGNRLGLGRDLAWRLTRLACAENPIIATQFLPGEAGIGLLLKAAASHGVSPERIEAVRRSDGALREFVQESAGNRKSFEAMLAGAEHNSRIGFEERRAMFRAGSTIWGARARHKMSTLLIRPSESVAGMIDGLSLSGLFDLERLRPDVPWIIRRTRVVDEDMGEDPVKRRALVAETGTDQGYRLLHKYCSEPLPELREFTGHDGMLYTEIVSSPIGRAGASTFVMGEVATGAVPIHPKSTDRNLRANMIITTPVECATYDLYVHEDLNMSEGVMSLYGMIQIRPEMIAFEKNDVPLYEPSAAVDLGIYETGAPNSRIERYEEMITDAIDLAGWKRGQRYRGYRAQIEFPPAPCRLCVVCEHREPER